MHSLTFTPGRASLVSDSAVPPWRVVFDDDGPAAYLYVCDLSRGAGEDSIIDAMLIYNAAALTDRTTPRVASVEWSRDGLRAVLYLDGTPQALADFALRQSFCRTNFPNFLDDQGGGAWRASSHAWDEAALQRFEAELYA